MGCFCAILALDFTPHVCADGNVPEDDPPPNHMGDGALDSAHKNKLPGDFSPGRV